MQWHMTLHRRTFSLLHCCRIEHKFNSQPAELLPYTAQSNLRWRGINLKCLFGYSYWYKFFSYILKYTGVWKDLILSKKLLAWDVSLIFKENHNCVHTKIKTESCYKCVGLLIGIYMICGTCEVQSQHLAALDKLTIDSIVYWQSSGTNNIESI